jgi:hypothetical protein
VNGIKFVVFLLPLSTASCERADAEQPVEVFLQGGTFGQTGGRSSGQGGTSQSNSDAESGRGGATLLSRTGPQLAESHPGYGTPTCFDCHGAFAPYPHTQTTYEPPNCVACHGYNGAAHRDHAVVENPGCANCHQSVAHVSKFEVPKDCITCHNQT